MIILVAVATALLWTGCAKMSPQVKELGYKDAESNMVLASAASAVPGRTLIWADEFNGTTINQTKWNIKNNLQRRRGIDGAWTGWHPNNVYQENGSLVIRTSLINGQYCGGALDTRGKFEIDSGYFEARVKLQTQVGHWGAFWLFTPSVQNVGNDGRDGTELDIFESPYVGKGQDLMQSAIHYDGYGTSHQKQNIRVPNKNMTNGKWHVFGMEWKKNKPYKFYYDGQLVWETSFGGISQVKQHIILSDEVGAWDGTMDIRTAALPDYMQVDYVRVYDYKTPPTQ